MGWSDAWRDYSLHLRGILKQLGVAVRPCSPGEPEDCGSSHAHHCISYLAALKAKADDGLRHVHHGDPAGLALAEELYQYWLTAFAAVGHDPATAETD